MSAFECWEEQRGSLRAALKEQPSVPDQVYAIRHALMQTEQNTLAQQSDEILRQQMGVLFSLVKGSVSFLETPVAVTSWVAQSRREEKTGGKAWLVVLAALLMVFSGLCCYFRGIVLGWVSALAALIAGSAALLSERRKNRKPARHEEVRVTLQPDVERLLAVLDGQMRAIDRCANDFAYLNDSLQGREPGQLRHGGTSGRPDGGGLRAGGRRTGRGGRSGGRAAEGAGLPGCALFSGKQPPVYGASQ